MDLARALRETMEELGLRPEHLAIVANVSVTQISRYLDGTSKPKYDSLMALRREYKSFAARIDQDSAAA